MEHRKAAVAYASSQHNRFLDELVSLGKIPSVSTLPEMQSEMQRTAEWLADHLKRVGLENVQIFPTGGHPVIFGQKQAASSEAPTVLIYGHYDVQPAEPLEPWKTPPFTPTIVGESIYGRGMTDMKGQVMASINAIEAILATGDIPINVKFIIEGEEEIGSPHLAAFLRNHKDMLASDLALNPDTGILSADQPSITYALRGMAYFELRVFGPIQDLHSGAFGGVVHNPAQALAELIAGMHDQNGRITLPGFYDRVRPLSDEERVELARLPLDEDYFLKNTGAPALWGEPDYTPYERVGARPTLEVNGLYSGFIGEGGKTVLPAYAMAKISMRLVPDQDPDEVARQFHQYLQEHASHAIRYEVKQMSGSPAAISDRHSRGIEALSKAMQTVWNKPPMFKREGGSVPVVTHFQQILGIESVNTGFSMSEDNMHGPNEKMHLPTWKRGTEALIHFFFNLGEK